ncbi:topoisomerase DNA-binding C4 zinc finger domain-containing protein [Helicobacter pylori]|uniref:topoisomerase DNA-binding C4 zinc finger domain-containing protein n=1 Tax=Helicobacter pylori TaxID=210 RepID=UPI000EB1027D|nr:topoisomerase DNA-binding C4 zinc finger domain-containing protein [Helicobacter pylori]
MSLATSYNVSNNFSKFNIKRVREYLICLVCNTPKMIQRELNGVSFYGCSNYVNKGDCKGVLREINGSMKMVCLHCENTLIMEKVESGRGGAYACKNCNRKFYFIDLAKQNERKKDLEKEKKELLNKIEKQKIKRLERFILAGVKANIKENSFFLGCKNYHKCKWTASMDSQDPKCPKCNRLMKRKKNFKNNEFFTAVSLILNAREFCLYINLKKKETNV